MLEVGKSAPDFCLNDQTGSESCLKDFKGKWVVLYFYPKDNTPGCTKEAIEFSKFLKDFDKMGAVILGTSADSIESHQHFITKQSLKINLLSDPDKEVLEKYGAWQKKKLYGRSFLGIVRSTYLIDPEGKIAHVWPKVKVAGHAEAVKGKLAELQNK
jgi:peroxiredoxin Q/BCP